MVDMYHVQNGQAPSGSLLQKTPIFMFPPFELNQGQGNMHIMI